MAVVDDHKPGWGWSPVGYECRGEVVSGRLARGKEGLPDLARDAYAGTGAAVLFDGSDYGTATVKVRFTVGSGGQPADLARAEEIRLALLNLGWTTGEKIRVNPFGPPPGRTGNDKATWLQSEVTIATSLDPVSWGSLLDQYPGLVVTSLSVDPSKLTAPGNAEPWTISGVLYAMP